MFSFFAVTLTDLKDSVSILGTFFAMYIGWQGLNTWQRQLRGNDEYQIARRLMRLCQKLRRLMGKARRGTVDEADYNKTLIERLNDQGANYQGREIRTEILLERNWFHIRALLEEIEDITVDAEAFWGSIVTDKVGAIAKLVYFWNSKRIAFVLLQDFQTDDGESRWQNRQQRELARAVVFEMTEDDSYSKDFRRVTDDLVEFARPKIIQSGVNAHVARIRDAIEKAWNENDWVIDGKD